MLPFKYTYYLPVAEKGTPFGRSLSVWAIIGSAPGGDHITRRLPVELAILQVYYKE